MKNVFKISILLWLSIGVLASCSKSDDGIDDNPNDDPNDDPTNHTDETIILDCNYFYEDRILTKIPNAKVDYVITCMMEVKGEIIIEPGVVIEFEQGITGIRVTLLNRSKYYINAVGSPDKPIIFRGVKKEMGSWAGIRFESNNDNNELKHVIIQDAGNKYGGETNSGGVFLAHNSTLKMTHTTISNCKNYGFNFNNHGLNLTLGNNIYTKNDVPMFLKPNYLDKLDANSSYSGNTNDHVNIDTFNGGINIVQTNPWRKLDVPYKLIGYDAIVITVDVSMEAGVEVIMSSHSSLVVYNGTLRMNGTAQDKIIFRGEKDVPAYWNSISFVTSSGTLNKMSHVEIRNAGKTIDPERDPNGAVRLIESFMVMDNITFTNCFDFAVSMHFNEKGNSNDFTYSNIVLNNTPRMFGDFSNNERQL